METNSPRYSARVTYALFALIALGLVYLLFQLHGLNKQVSATQRKLDAAITENKKTDVKLDKLQAVLVPSSTTPTPITPTVSAAPDPYQITVTRAWRFGKGTLAASGSSGETSDWVAVTVAIKNISAQSVYLDALNFKLKDEQFTYPQDPLTGYTLNEKIVGPNFIKLASEQLGPGDQTSGSLIFRAVNSSTSFELSYGIKKYTVSVTP